MTLFEKVTQSPDVLAAFMYGLIQGAEEHMLEQMHSNGIQASIVRWPEEYYIQDNLQKLLQEVPEVEDGQDT